MSDLRQNVAVAVRTARKSAGLSQEALAGIVGTSVEAISNIERGRSTPSLDLFRLLSATLKLDALGLLEQKARATDAPSAERLALESDVALLVQRMTDEELATWVRLGRALRVDD